MTPAAEPHSAGGAPHAQEAPAVVRLRNASLAFGERTLWSGLDLDIRPGEFFAVLGPNGSGKTTFLKALLGVVPLTSGTAEIAGRPPGRRGNEVGYIPQQKMFPPSTPLRARDLVSLGVDGHRWGIRLRHRAVERRVDELLAKVGATDYAKVPVGLLSGGEQQRLRVAQAIAGQPRVLLCDEPLLSLDLHHQQAVSRLIDAQRRDGAAVVFVTHEINPVLDYLDRVLYIADGRFRIGTVDEVMTTDVLSELYGSRVEVSRVNGRLVVVGLPDATTHAHAPEHRDQEQPA
ncbi:ABC transporter ATP-binding protein [Sinomonas cyclohexanicum]|uniref:ABC transporter ATP-binding protein n=1 Tax=Sinomonas cyclohexanicum TaxID=322009 RepID=A0ABN6FIX6_SINCY|nr:ABC transporter ATP-binding protein [Corynebacterium cyclohexanicum]BCT76716.1 ABC transporter ATP-binding protein [Corynebacterium cyclohexanicum]